MNATRAAVLAVAVLGALLAALPAAQAQETLQVEEIWLQSPGGDRLSAAAEDDVVQIHVRVANTGAAGTSQSPVRVDITINGPAGAESLSDNRVPSRQKDGETIYIVTWTPSVTGAYEVTATVSQGGHSSTYGFTVNEHAVPAGNLVERLSDYAWLVIMFVATVVLLLSLVSRRRQYA